MKRPAGVIVGSLGILFAGVVLFACGSSGSSNDSPPLDEASTPAPDGQAEAADGRDSATKDGGADVVAIDAPDLANYHDLTDNKLWEEACELGWQLTRKGNNLPAQDIIIAACARRVGAAVLTFDRHFDAIPGLTVVHSLDELRDMS